MFNGFVQKYVTVKNIIFFVIAILFLKFLGYIQEMIVIAFINIFFLQIKSIVSMN